MKHLLAVATLIGLFTGSTTMAQEAPTPMVRLAELEIDPAQLDSYLGFLRGEIDTSVRIEPGVLSLNAVAVKGKPNHIRLMEIYADQAAYEAHIQSPHFQKYKIGTAKMVISLVLLETDPVMLRSKPTSAK